LQNFLSKGIKCLVKRISPVFETGYFYRPAVGLENIRAGIV
jgi:hypothetical protein